MSEEIASVQLLVEGGRATPGGSMAPALGPLGVNLGMVVQEINKVTQSFEGMTVPVTVNVNKATRKFTIDVGLPPASALILNEAGLKKGTGQAGKEIIGDMKYTQILKVAQAKRPDLLAATLKAASKEILGTMVSMGITCEGLDVREVQKKIDAGDFDDQIAEFEKSL